MFPLFAILLAISAVPVDNHRRHYVSASIHQPSKKTATDNEAADILLNNIVAQTEDAATVVEAAANLTRNTMPVTLEKTQVLVEEAQEAATKANSLFNAVKSMAHAFEKKARSGGKPIEEILGDKDAEAYTERLTVARGIINQSAEELMNEAATTAVKAAVLVTAAANASKSRVVTDLNSEQALLREANEAANSFWNAASLMGRTYLESFNNNVTAIQERIGKKGAEAIKRTRLEAAAAKPDARPIMHTLTANRDATTPQGEQHYAQAVQKEPSTTDNEASVILLDNLAAQAEDAATVVEAAAELTRKTLPVSNNETEVLMEEAKEAVVKANSLWNAAQSMVHALEEKAKNDGTPIKDIVGETNAEAITERLTDAGGRMNQSAEELMNDAAKTAEKAAVLVAAAANVSKSKVVTDLNPEEALLKEANEAANSFWNAAGLMGRTYLESFNNNVTAIQEKIGEKGAEAIKRAGLEVLLETTTTTATTTTTRATTTTTTTSSSAANHNSKIDRLIPLTSMIGFFATLIGNH